MTGEAEPKSNLSEADELAAQNLGDLIGAGLVKAVREPDGIVVYQVTEFGRRFSKEEANALFKRLDLLDNASDTEH